LLARLCPSDAHHGSVLPQAAHDRVFHFEKTRFDPLTAQSMQNDEVLMPVPACETIKDLIIPGFGVFFAFVGGVITIYIYHSNSKLRRAEWIYSFYKKLYYKSNYREIRRLLDYGGEDDLKRLRDALQNHSDVSLEERLVDYLNFFQFIAILQKSGQLPIDEIQMMFGYYIGNIRKYKFILKYLKGQEFGVLLELIERSGKEA
jgi:hypothetical protein